MMMNAVTFQVMGFEHYMGRAMRHAEEFLTDPAILAEARALDRAAATPCFQYLADPMLDHRSVASDHPNTGHFGWTREHNRFGWDSPLGGMDRTAVSNYASHSMADDLTGLPYTYIHIGAIDLFFEESLDYARRLTRASVAVELQVWPGAFHTFGMYDGHVSREARRVARTAILRGLHGDAT